MILGYTEEQLKDLGATFTATEINQQPELWLETWEIVKNNQDKIKTFLNQVVSKDTRIILTGAGTSDYIGCLAQVALSKKLDCEVIAIPSTDLVANPYDYIKQDKKTLLISYGRSGNSPESVGAIEVLSPNINDFYNLVVTCNKDGKLAKMATSDKDLVIMMPERSDDQSFAMTGSYSCMTLFTLLAFDIDNIDANKPMIEAISKQGNDILQNKQEEIKKIVELKNERIVYLGSSDNKELCKEMALKNLELTSGKVATVCEGTMGFRHGPKSIINDNTGVILMMTSNEYTKQYEMDLIREIHGDDGGHKMVVIDYNNDPEIAKCSDIYIAINGAQVNTEFKAFNYMLVGQMFSLYNSISLGISPDNPRPDGTVNRVVKGVTLHKYTR